MLSDGREPSQKPGGIVLKSASPSEDYPGVTAINLHKGTAKKDVRAAISILENDNTASLSLGGDEGKFVSIRVDQKDGKIGFFGENDKVIFTMP
jgi:hypothetical protein